MRFTFLSSLLVLLVALVHASGARQNTPIEPAKPTEHVLGTITAADPANQTITVKDDKTGTETVVSVGATRTIFRVEPGAKDLSKAIRIPASDLQQGDRVDVRGFKAEDGQGIEARSVVLMSAQDLEQKRTAEMQAWENATVGTVINTDPQGNALTIRVRKAEGPAQVTVHAAPATEFTRYSEAAPQAPARSQISDIQAGDQVHVIGTPSADGTIAAEKIYSAPLRTIAGTVSAITAASNQVTIRNLQTKQSVTITLGNGAAVKKLPLPMAMTLARRLNPNYHPPEASGATGGQSGGANGGQRWAGQGGTPGAGAGGAGASGPAGPGRADLSRMLDHVPAIALTDLKPGDAVVVWGLVGHDTASLTASMVLAGVEPVLQSAPQRQGQSVAADWGFDAPVPAQ